MINEQIIKYIIDLAKTSAKKGDFPVGAVIVRKNKIISKGYNKKEQKKNSIYHAEIIAITKACKKLQTWHLDDCTLYTTMEPCLMCYGAIMQSRIKKIVFLAKNESFGAFSANNIKINKKMNIVFFKNDEYIQLIQKFFTNKRSNVSRETL